MRLGTRRRNIVVWSMSIGPTGRYVPLGVAPAAPAKRVRRRLRLGARLTVIGLLHFARTLRLRWQLAAGVVLTAAGLMLRGTGWGGVLLPGLLLLLSTPLVPVSPTADRKRRSQLARELAAYSTLAQRCDLEATLDRYPDSDTRELRDILAGQFVAGCGNGIPGAPHRQ